MKRFVVREYKNFAGGRVLLPLPELIGRLAFVQVHFWALRQLTFVCRPLFFGIPVPEVEKLSTSLPRGLVLADLDFRRFLETDMQVIDGYIDAYSTSADPLFQIECIDTAQWEICTNDPDFALELGRRGFAARSGPQAGT